MFVYGNDPGLRFDDWAGGAVASPPPPRPTAPPAAPTNLTAIAVSPTRIDISWTDNATEFRVFEMFRCVGDGCTGLADYGTTRETSFSDVGLTPSTQYSYRVRAFNAQGNSDFSNRASATTPASPSSPPQRGGALAQDHFDRANEGGLADDWASGPSGFTELQLVANSVRGVVSGGDGVSYYRALTWPDDQWSEVRLTGLSGRGDGGVAVRISPFEQTAYVLAVYGTGNFYVVGKFGGRERHRRQTFPPRWPAP